ncbi:hypothetical protein ACHHYP_15309 [Achlya hypogyna]|uniref:Uncharacterized protein n=1 Tax=Achlya hypogyna TaxID=1202772 RepID=A0A1V9YB48_ACHHY|nr:hypothetical protein ACHHYP_15309 [Achlya hypogyna]
MWHNVAQRAAAAVALMGATVSGTYLTVELAISHAEDAAALDRQAWTTNMLPLKLEAQGRSPADEEERARLALVVAQVDAAEARLLAAEKDVIDMKISWRETQQKVQTFFQ